MAAILKNLEIVVTHGSIALHEIWQDDAFWPCLPYRP